MRPDFLKNNFLSNDKRYPLTKIQANSARALGTNAMSGHIWDNFSSQTYKELPLPDEVDLYNPFDKTSRSSSSRRRNTPAPAITVWHHSLVSWSSAPFLHNNTLGKFTGDPSVAETGEAYTTTPPRSSSGPRNVSERLPSGALRTNATCICENSSPNRFKLGR
jgi:hypothetical protein